MTDNELLKQINTDIKKNGLEDRITSEEMRKVLTEIVYSKLNKSELDNLKIGMIYQNPVQKKVDLVITYPNPEKGWTAIVKEEGFIYQYDGLNWKNTGLTIFPSDVASKGGYNGTLQDLENIKSNKNEGLTLKYVDKITNYPVTTWVGGAIIEKDIETQVFGYTKKGTKITPLKTAGNTFYIDVVLKNTLNYKIGDSITLSFKLHSPVDVGECVVQSYGGSTDGSTTGTMLNKVFAIKKGVSTYTFTLITDKIYTNYIQVRFAIPNQVDTIFYLANQISYLGLPVIAPLVDNSINKVDKITGKGLSTNDFTDKEKNKLSILPLDSASRGGYNGTLQDLENIKSNKNEGLTLKYVDKITNYPVAKWEGSAIIEKNIETELFGKLELCTKITPLKVAGNIFSIDVDNGNILKYKTGDSITLAFKLYSSVAIEGCRAASYGGSTDGNKTKTMLDEGFSIKKGINAYTFILTVDKIYTNYIQVTFAVPNQINTVFYLANQTAYLGLPVIAPLVDNSINKVDKITGKGLSTNDFTDKEKSKLSILPLDSAEKGGYNGTLQDLENSTKTAQESIGVTHSKEFVYTIIDKENKIVFGIKTDGSIYAPKGVPEEVYKLLEGVLSQTDIEQQIVDSEKPVSAAAIHEIIQYMNTPYVYSIIDSASTIVLGITSSGEIIGNFRGVEKLKADSKKLDVSIKKLEEEVESLKNINVPIHTIINWGDSLTANGVYSSVMQQLLGSDYKVYNCGVGGETVPTIASRQGGVPAFITEGFILPADGSKVEISTILNCRIKNILYDRDIRILRQGSGNSINPCYINNIECTLSVTQTSSTSTDAVWYIKRNTPTLSNDKIQANTPVFMYGNKFYRNPYATVLWIGQNGGYSDNDELVDYYKRMIEYSGTSNYIIIGLHSGTAASRVELELTMTKAFGHNYINWRKYISSLQAFGDAGLVATQEDSDAISEGSLPPAFWSSPTDKVHLNAVGYTLLGNLIVKRFKQLGIII